VGAADERCPRLGTWLQRERDAVAETKEGCGTRDAALTARAPLAPFSLTTTSAACPDFLVSRLSSTHSLAGIVSKMHDMEDESQ
jgi:hypothetical protein